jgi:RND family efflux transporter MFP subunit
MAKWKWYILSIAGLVAGSLACKQKPQAMVLPGAQDTIAVRLAPVQQGALAGSVVTTGLLFTEDESKLSFKVGGVIESVPVGENDFVKAGQVLATLKSTEIAAQVAQVQLNVQKAQRDYERTLNLYRDSVATLEQLQNAKTGLDIAQQALTSATFNQQYARIYAPASGFIVKKLMAAGEIAGPGMPVLVLNHVSGASHWVLKAGVTDAQWATIKTGDKAMVEFDAYPGQSFEGIVSQRALSADPANGTFTIDIRVFFTGQRPAIGMFGKARIASTAPATYAAVIPYSALLEANGSKGYVFVSSHGSRVQKKEVMLGKMYDDRVEVLSGLENERYIVVAGSAFLSENSNIKIIE